MQTSETSDESIGLHGGTDELARSAWVPLGLAVLAWGLVGAGLGLCLRMQEGRRTQGVSGKGTRNLPMAAPVGAMTRSLTDRRAEDGRRLARIDHDLRTPLGAIAAALAVIRGAQDEKALRDDALAVIDRQAHRMHSIAQSLRVLADDMSKDTAPRSASER